MKSKLVRIFEPALTSLVFIWYLFFLNNTFLGEGVFSKKHIPGLENIISLERSMQEYFSAPAVYRLFNDISTFSFDHANAFVTEALTHLLVIHPVIEVWKP